MRAKIPILKFNLNEIWAYMNIGWEHNKGFLGTVPVRVDIKSPNGLRMPSGNELGADKYWSPDGYTSGRIKEAVIAPAPKETYTINRIK